MDLSFLSPEGKKLVITFAVVLGLYIVSFLLRKLINYRVEDLFQRHSYRRIVFYLFAFVSLIFVIIYWVENVAALSAIFGGLGAALALALHKPILRTIAWFTILIYKLYKVGDRIQIGDLVGDVIDIRIYYTIMLEIGHRFDHEQSTGRIVHMPNEKVLLENIYNYSKGFEYIWHEIPITVTFESDVPKAKQILMDVLNSNKLKVHQPARQAIDKLTSKHVIQYRTLTPIVWEKIIDIGIQLDMRYLTRVREIRTTENYISEEVLKRFNAEPDVEFAYPTIRYYTRGEEHQS